MVARPFIEDAFPLSRESENELLGRMPAASDSAVPDLAEVDAPLALSSSAGPSTDEQDPASVGAGSGLASLRDSAGRPNQRLAFGGPPRTRPEDTRRLVWRWPAADRSESSGLRQRAGLLPLRSSGGCPAPPSTLRSAQTPRHPLLNLGDSTPAPPLRCTTTVRTGDVL